MAITFGILALSLVGLLIVQQLISRWQFNAKYKLPPVVPGWPLLGNALNTPFPGGMWGVEMAKKYGDMYTCYFGGKPFVYINSSRIVDDLLEKRAAIYSSRPYRPMSQEIMSGGSRMLLMTHDDRWRNQRKIMHSILNGKSAEKTFVPYQELEAKQLVYDYLNNTDNFHVCNQRFSNSVITSVVFGRRSGLHDRQLKEILDLVEVFSQYLWHPLKNIPDVFPWLHNLPRPLQWWRREAEEYFIKARALYKKEFDAFEEKLENGTARPCFAADLVAGAAKKEFSIDETEKLFVFSTLLEAGSDTSRNAITQSVAAMAIYPEWVKKARGLLDEVCGANAERLPSLADRESLPYITAAVKEALRWRPFIQNGVPHMLSQDDEYGGYKFPAGTQFAWNAYAIALNENEYKDPMTFNPDRFMNADLNNPLKGHWQFGAGRRVCVGYNVGANNIWIAIACLIYCFDVSEDPDHPIDTLNTIWDVHKDAPFKAIIKPRSPEHIELIKRVSAEALAADY